jgi:phosphotransferase family enzyme
MSYPREIQTLVIEDESSVIETYKEYFASFEREGYSVAPIRVAQSFSDGQAELDRDRIIHFVVLDLRLPEVPGGASEDASARGLELVSRIATRDRYPVPVLLIVTGDLRRANPFEQLHEQLQKSFYYGRIIAKRLELRTDFNEALDAVLRYCDIGIHLTGGPADMYPPISPREEDLLRRCTLMERRIGIDLRWWSADRRDRGGTGRLDWVKVLQGRFLLGGDAGVSRSRFFKFEPVENGMRSRAGAATLAQKLNHIRVIVSIEGSGRHLLVTDKAGPSNNEPISLSAFLAGAAFMGAYLPMVAADIANQLSQLGDTTNEQLRTSTLLWTYHNAEKLAQACEGADLKGDDPARVLQRLLELDAWHWCDVRTRHGDLHIHNVSLDWDAGSVRAYVIDPGSMGRGPAARDIASLEVSLVLHQQYELSAGSLVSACVDLYDGSSPDGSDGLATPVSQHQGSTRGLIQALRPYALQHCKAPLTYAILLLDEVLIQLGGLSFGTSQNKIYRESDAIDLFRYLSTWLQATM